MDNSLLVSFTSNRTIPASDSFAAASAALEAVGCQSDLPEEDTPTVSAEAPASRQGPLVVYSTSASQKARIGSNQLSFLNTNDKTPTTAKQQNTEKTNNTHLRATTSHTETDGGVFFSR